VGASGEAPVAARILKEESGMTTCVLPGEAAATTSTHALHGRAGSFFRALSTEALTDLGSHAFSVSYKAGARLYAEDDIPVRVFVLLQGQVKLSIKASNGRGMILRIAKLGELLGVSAAISGSQYEETAQAITACTAVSLRREEFERFLAMHPSACQAVMREIGFQYEQACARLRLTGIALSASAKLARLLLQWSSTVQHTEYGVRIHVALTHGEIGECIGSCRESVTRIFSDLQRRRIAEFRGSILTIMDRGALETYAGSSWPSDIARCEPNPVVPRARMRCSVNA